VTGVPRGLAVLGLVLALTGAAHSAVAAPLGVIDVAQEDTPADVPPDAVPPDAVPPDEMPPDDSATATPTVSPTATPTATLTPTPTATPTPNATATANAIQQVIQHSNDEQVQAISTRNLSLVSDTVTDDHFRELVGILQDMLNSKVNSIALLKLDWGPIVVAADGTSAVATTYETWRIVSQAGTIDYDPVRNDYTLVFGNAAWKVKSDVQVVGPAQTTGTGGSPP
jgi:hypothetical protein